MPPSTWSVPSSAARRESAVGLGCLMLFSLPFVAAGLFVLAAGLRAGLAGDWAQGLPQAGVGLFFAVVGLGILATALRGARRRRREQAQLAERPGEPWRLRADWAAARVDDGGRAALGGLLVFATFWNLLCWPIAYVVLQRAPAQGDGPKWLVAIFPLVGLGLAVGAARLALRRRKFGASVLELAACPAPLGRELRATLLAGPALGPTTPIGLTLSAFRRYTTGSGKNRSTHEDVLWQETQEVRGTQERRVSGMRLAVPVRFAIPRDVPPTDTIDAGDGIHWKLEATASVPGIDYAAAFDVPVYRTAESDAAEAAAPPPAVADAALLASYRPPAGSKIRVTRTAHTATLDFPAARYPGAAAGLTAFWLLWTGICWLLVHLSAPMLFPLVFGAFDLLLLYGVVMLWWWRSRVEADGRGVRVVGGLPGLMRTTTVPASGIAAIELDIGTRAGSRAYYDLTLRCTDGDKVPLARMVGDHREAEWLAAVIREATGAGRAAA